MPDEKKNRFLIIFIAGKLDFVRSPELALRFHNIITKTLGSATPIAKSGSGGALVYSYSAACTVNDVAEALTKQLLSRSGFMLDSAQRIHDALLVFDISEQSSWYATSEIYRAAASLG
jgi:hypothetical protein